VLLTGHGKDSVDTLDWPSLARDRQTLAVYMGVRRFPELMQNLTSHGRSADTPIAIIERGTTPEERVVRGTLGQLPMLAEAHGIRSPAMLIIGEVARQGAISAPTMAGEYSVSPTTTQKSAIQRG
jgi:uroporphyrin-III C-methyltransferase/precorrin-2 dehydrogenase/sirohydrochlorin ferrochelatase